jgi:CheY-like chemotaxis protein
MSHGAARPVRVLVCDDNRDAADTLGELVRVFGYEAVVCYDGPSAVAAAASFRPDVCLLDLLMPGADGYTLAGWLREQAGGRPVLLVAVTAKGGTEAVRRSREAGFDLHLVKPVAPEAIAAALARAPGRGLTRRTPDPDHPTESPEEVAAHLVAAEWADGAWLVVLRTPDGTPVCFGPYQDPELARERAEAAQRFVAAVIRVATGCE